MENLVAVKGLRKYFEGNEALKGIDLDIPKGTILGLLGPNGAGKTTLIRHLTQIYLPDQGSILFAGKPLQPSHIANIGYMPEEKGLYKKMKVGEHLIYLARLRGLKKAEAKSKVEWWLNHFAIIDWWNKTLDELSKGMQQKVQFIATVLHNPDLLILDEPFSGLDPINANLLKEEIIRIKNLGTTIIFSTHRMESVEEMCESIALINKGEIILQGKVTEIQHQFKHHEFSVSFDASTPFSDSLVEKYKIRFSSKSSAIIKLEEDIKPSFFLREALNAGVEIFGLSEILPSIHDIFIEQVQNHRHA